MLGFYVVIQFAPDVFKMKQEQSHMPTVCLLHLLPVYLSTARRDVTPMFIGIVLTWHRWISDTADEGMSAPSQPGPDLSRLSILLEGFMGLS